MTEEQKQDLQMPPREDMFGFYGTMAAQIWDVAFEEVRHFRGFGPTKTRAFLRSRIGRQLANDVLRQVEVCIRGAVADRFPLHKKYF